MSDLEEIIRRGTELCVKATPGPWISDGGAHPYAKGDAFSESGASIDGHNQSVVVGGMQDEQGGAVGVISNADAAFIAYAREAVPALLSALSRAQALAEAAEKAEAQFRDYERQHLAKDPPQVEKADANRLHADFLASAIASFRSPE